MSRTPAWLAVRPGGRWSSKRKGFKHRLVLALRAHDFKYRQATAVVEAIFATMKEALLRHEAVEFPFGSLYVRESMAGRVVRFGKVITVRKFKVAWKTKERPRRKRAPNTFRYWGPRCPDCETIHPVFHQLAGKGELRPVSRGDRLPIALACPCGGVAVANTWKECAAVLHDKRVKIKDLALAL